MKVMRLLKSMRRGVLLGAIVVVAGGAGAQQPQQPQQPDEASDLPVCSLDPANPDKLLVEPCRPAPPQGTRRSVPQVVQAMPAQAVRPVYGLHPAPAPPPFNPTGPGPTLGPAAPLPVNSCDIGGCRDASGARHDGGAGNATLDANGRVCHRNGVWLQCF